MSNILEKKINYINISNFTTKKINLCCGNMYHEGYINIDFPDDQVIYNRRKSPDISANLNNLYFDNNSLEYIEFRHTLEHYQRHQAIILLIRFNSWLKIGAILDLAMPDINACIKEYINASYKRQKELIRHCWGSHEGDWATHCEGWNVNTIEEILLACGFEIFENKSYNGQWPQFITKSYKRSGVDISKIKSFLKDFSPADEGHNNILLDYWMNDIDKELNDAL
jgi:predicted SAM-dependent methyltransferase